MQPNTLTRTDIHEITILTKEGTGPTRVTYRANWPKDERCVSLVRTVSRESLFFTLDEARALVVALHELLDPHAETEKP
jgi:hypothetical protein